jgi:hypothetical protein
MTLGEFLKKVGKVVGGLAELLWSLAVIYDALTNRGAFTLLSSWFGGYADVVYYLLVLVALLSLVLFVFWLGHRYYDSVSKWRIWERLKRTSAKPKENIEKAEEKTLEPTIFLRRDAPSLEEFISKAKSSLTFLGVTLEDVVRQHVDAIARMLRDSEITMTFMVFNPDSPLLELMKHAFAPNPSGAIRTTLETLIELKNQLSHVEKQRLEIRICDLVPFNSMICVDAGTEDAMMEVEQRLYTTGSRSRPCMIISKRKHSTIYYTYWNSFIVMKSKSKEVK